MAIQKSKAFVTSDNKVFLTQEEAQKHEIEQIFAGVPDIGIVEAERSADAIMHYRDKLLAILSTRKPRVAKAAKSKIGKSNRAAAVNAALQDSKQ